MKNTTMQHMTSPSISEAVDFEICTDIADVLTCEDVFRLLQTSLTLYELVRNVQTQTKSSAMLRHLPFMSTVSCQFEAVPLPAGEAKEHQERLSDNIAAWGFTLHPVNGDGNCCFSSLACSLLFQKRDILASLPTFSRDFRIQNNESSAVSVADIASELRQKAVAEWCNNADYYQGFLPQGYEVQEEAMKFKQHGYFFGPLGNTMVLAVSNAVGLPVIVLSSAHHHSVVYTTPRVCKASIPLWIAYNQANSGHYDALILRDLSQETPRSSPQAKVKRDTCACGKSDRDSTKQHCTAIQRKYTAIVRCPCLAASRPCSASCICKNCSNPNGIAPCKPESPRERKRQRYSWQQDSTQQKSAVFALEQLEDVTKGPRTLLEYLLVAQIVKHTHQKEIECGVEIVHSIYEACVELASALELTVPLGSKTKHAIMVTLQEYEQNRKTFEALCVSQLKINYK